MTKAQVLVVEDENIVALDIQDRLTRLGYAVLAIVPSGEEAIRRAATMRPDLVLMDIRLRGEMDGVEAAEQIQTRFDIPVVYLTAYADETTLRRAKITEPFGYLLKPLEERELHTTIEMALYKHRAEKRLKEYTIELQARNQELDAFARIVAHDLKNPLSLTIAYARVLEMGYATMSEEDLKSCLKVMVRNGLKMNSIIDDLLLLANTRQMEVEMATLDMASIVTEAQQRLIYLIEEYQAEITAPDTWPVTLGYAPWIEAVWANYLSNAIKYGGRPPHIELGFDELVNQHRLADSVAIRFWVRDNGSGLTSEEQGRLFTPFAQIDSSTRRAKGHGLGLSARRAKGHGLGLSIVRQIVEKLGGQVWVESQIGHGSVFGFTLSSDGS